MVRQMADQLAMLEMQLVDQMAQQKAAPRDDLKEMQRELSLAKSLVRPTADWTVLPTADLWAVQKVRRWEVY